MRRALLIPLLMTLGAWPLAFSQEPEAQPVPVDVGEVLRGSKEFAGKCQEFKISFAPGEVRALGYINMRGGPCEYLITVSPAKAHETIILLDKGEAKPRPKRKIADEDEKENEDEDEDEQEQVERRRPEPLTGLAETLNNAFLAAGFTKGDPLRWNDDGEIFPPSGETVHLYAEWKGEDGKEHRARITDWLWAWATVDAMRPGLYVFTGSVILDEGPPTNKKWLGCEVDGLVAAVLSTSSAIVDHLEEGAIDNGAFEAIPARVPEIGTRVTCVFSRKEMAVTENYEPLKLTPELEAEKARLADERAKRDAAKAEPATPDETRESGEK